MEKWPSQKVTSHLWGEGMAVNVFTWYEGGRNVVNENI
jgi:hypothetical protein